MNSEEKKELSFEAKYKAFKEGKGAAPVIHKEFQVTVNPNDKQVTLTREEVDRDGETVVMSGMILRSWIKENGLPLIDSHEMRGVVKNGLGALRNPRIEDREGRPALVGDPDFAPTENGKQAEILYLGVDGGKPYFTNVSMGFAVYDYDNETRKILSWEPFEASLVTVGAVMSARFSDKTAKVDTEKIAKELARYKQIREPFKEVTKLFLSDDFCKLLGYEKDGDMLVDFNAIYDIIVTKFETKQVAPIKSKEAPKELVFSGSEVADLITATIKKSLEQNS